MLHEFENCVFVNCPFDKEYEPILQAILFCVVELGFYPRLATESADGGETRLDKIKELIKASKYSIHDLSRCEARNKGEMFRLNMPFELGIDFGCREYYRRGRENKKFLILEEKRYRFQAALSDIAGCDIEVHGAEYEKAIKVVRNWLCDVAEIEKVETNGPSAMVGLYTTFLGWLWESRLALGYSEQDIKDLSTNERLSAMKDWIDLERPEEAS